ncbi:MAG: outer membrane lipoprotein chaperone LolA [Thiotrichaceae bacterium]|nr:outer membrane lipoprotein chaperone LolA [Thiotrichaceae bacterium]PCI11113.1 MAG: outer membrane lipoprotein carrier protein LolA [Thiotrichales bacterium]PCI13889.1 MAG: outer membrane lipoprotein carrier protein LolA [Thiotrichales bacterium]
MSRDICRFMIAQLVLLALFMPLSAKAGPGLERLDNFFEGLGSLRANFSQTVIDASAFALQESGGVLIMQRPDKFLWDYQRPYQQAIIADGKKIYIYDADLEQVTIKVMQKSMGDTPMLLLSSGGALDGSFVITEMGEEDGLEWLQLKPRAQQSNFSMMRLAFDKDTLRIMELVDGFDQTTRLQFSEVKRNPKIDSALFRFVAPAGVDVIEERADVIEEQHP